jgi:hypothetical protein
MRALLKGHEVVDRLGQLGKMADDKSGRNCLRRHIALIVRDENGFHPHLARNPQEKVLEFSGCP